MRQSETIREAIHETIRETIRETILETIHETIHTIRETIHGATRRQSNPSIATRVIPPKHKNSARLLPPGDRIADSALLVDEEQASSIAWAPLRVCLEEDRHPTAGFRESGENILSLAVVHHGVRLGAGFIGLNPLWNSSCFSS